MEYGRGGTIGIGNEPPQRRFQASKATNYAFNNKPNYTKIIEENRNEMNKVQTNERLNLLDVMNRVANRHHNKKNSIKERRKKQEKMV